MKIQIFEISKIFGGNRNFKILNFHWLFQRNFFRQKNRNFLVPKKSVKKCSDFFRPIFFSTKFFFGQFFRLLIWSLQIRKTYPARHLENTKIPSHIQLENGSDDLNLVTSGPSRAFRSRICDGKLIDEKFPCGFING